QYGSLTLPHGQLPMPVFMPDATLGVVRAVDATDLLNCEIQALVMNTFHLMQRPGSSTIQALGGLHKMSAWPRPIVTDSGGFQAYSLIQQNPKFGSMSDDGITFKPEGSERKFHLTPEKTIQLQVSYWRLAPLVLVTESGLLTGRATCSRKSLPIHESLYPGNSLCTPWALDILSTLLIVRKLDMAYSIARCQRAMPGIADSTASQRRLVYKTNGFLM